MNTSLRQTLALLVAPALLCLSLLPQAVQAASINGSGRSATETRSVGEFQAIRLSGSMDLQVRQGTPASVQVTADDNLLALLETVVESSANGPALDIRWQKGASLYTRSKVLVVVVTPKLTALAAAGAGDILVEAFSTPALKLSISGSGDARLKGLSTEDLGISIAGSGDVAGTGSATRMTVSIAGSGDVRLGGLKSDDVSVTIAGSGDAVVNANKSLDVRIAGSGDVSYTGNATVKSKVAGSGSVNKR